MSRRGWVWWLPAGWLIAGILASLTAGSGVGLGGLATVLFGGAGPDDFSAIVITELNLPRTVTAVLGGAAFAVAGLLLQEGLANRLAVPELLGVAPGAALAVTAVATFQVRVPAVLAPALAMAGGLAAAAVVVTAAVLVRSSQGILLVGAAVSAALSGLLVAVLSAGDGLQARALYRLLSGSLADVTWHQAGTVGWLLVLLPVAVLAAPVLGVLTLGPAAAAALGVNVTRARAAVVVLAVALVGVVVPVCGPVAWVGLLAPATVRAVLPGARVRSVLLLTMMIGAALTVTADLLARSVFAPIETPLGAWTAGMTVLTLGVVAGGRRIRGRTVPGRSTRPLVAAGGRR